MNNASFFGIDSGLIRKRLGTPYGNLSVTTSMLILGLGFARVRQKATWEPETGLKRKPLGRANEMAQQVKVLAMQV